MRHFLSILLLLLLPALPAVAQDDVMYRLELGAGLGANFGLTDVNSKPYGQTGLGAALVARFPLNSRQALKLSAAYGAIKGSTSGVKSFYPATTDAGATTERLQHTVSTGIVDVSALYELHFLPYGFYKGYQGFQRIVPYLQMGLGAAYGLEAKSFTMQVPVGFGVKYKVAPRVNLALDWTIHFTLSDKLDALEAPTTIPSSGFRNKDHYSLTLLTLTYDLSPRCPTCNKD